MLANTCQTLDQSLDISDSEELKSLRLDQANYTLFIVFVGLVCWRAGDGRWM